MDEDMTDFKTAVENVKQRSGKQLLDREDVMVLAGEEILRSTTWEEKKYTSGKT